MPAGCAWTLAAPPGCVQQCSPRRAARTTPHPLPPHTHAGVTPPYDRPLRPCPHHGAAVERDWRWAVGATPFGPYSNFSGMSDAAAAIARRNLLLSHVSAALRGAQERLDAFDAFVAAHLEGPWGAAGIGKDVQRRRRRFLETVTACVGGGSAVGRLGCGRGAHTLEPATARPSARPLFPP